MVSFPGLCVRCGGTQWWTLDSENAVWVKCQDDSCLEDQLLLPLGSEWNGGPVVIGDVLDPRGEEGVEIHEDGDGEARPVVQIGVPLEAVLLDLFTGGPESG